MKRYSLQNFDPPGNAQYIGEDPDGAYVLFRDHAARVEELEAALARSTQALDDWTSTYASEFCGEERVKEAWARIMANGGTLAYIADIVHHSHTPLKK